MTPVRDLVEAILSVPLRNGRRMIAIAGPPGSGKSTLADALHAQVPGSCVLPMDGFHLSNAELDARGLRARKGAPQTFDVAGFEAVLAAAAREGEVPYPTFDRASDMSIPAGGHISASDHTILVEGNYLLLDVAPWNALHHFWDYSIFLDVDLADLESRLIDRWLTHGHDAAEAQSRARGNDLANARYVKSHSVSANKVVKQGQT